MIDYVLRDAADNVIGAAQDGVGYIAFWKTDIGRGQKYWHSDTFYPSNDDDENPIFDEEDTARFAAILKEDGNAIFFNSYYNNIGEDNDRLTTPKLEKILKRQYRAGRFRLANVA